MERNLLRDPAGRPGPNGLASSFTGDTRERANLNRAVHVIFWSLVLVFVADAATGRPGAGGGTPPVSEVQAKLAREAARFAMLYADPSTAWREHFNQPNGWTVALLVVPDTTSMGPQYEVDGAELAGDGVPVYRFDHVRPFVLQPPDATTPMVGQAHVKFGLPYLSVDLPVSSLTDTTRAQHYELQLFTLVPVDTTDQTVVVRFDLVARFRGVIKNGSLTFASEVLPDPPPTTAVIRTMQLAATPAAPMSWGALKALYR